MINHGDILSPTPEQQDLVKILASYKEEGKTNRASGMNPRDEKWTQNLNLYWNRYDFSHKASWQAQEVMPEVPAFVDRFAAAMKEALVATSGNFYTVVDPADHEGTPLPDAIKRITDVWLSTCGRNQNGHPLGFPAVFEEQVKLGALTACCGTVLWKNDVPGGRVAFETIDPRFVWLDHTFRNLYRVREIEIDQHMLGEMLGMKDDGGKPLFDDEQLERLRQDLSGEGDSYRREMSGHGHESSSMRKPIVLDEYIATVIGKNGEVLADQALVVIANDKYLIRGPEKNPFWHQKDWLVYAPLVTAPLSVYGRSYMEDFGSLATTFTELTNLILDAAFTSALKAFVMVPSMLENPEQAAEGVHPMKMFMLEEGFRAEDFAHELNLGTLDPGAVQVWQILKRELSEAAGINEIGLGQFAPKGRTSATEVNTASSNSSALVRSIAQTIETRFLDPVLDLTWKTGLQHVGKKAPRLSQAAGPEMWNVLMAKRKEFVQHPFTFQAKGISELIQKSQMLQSLIQVLQVITQNDQLVAAFAEQVDFGKLVSLLFELSNIDPLRFSKTQRDGLIKSIAQPMQDRANGAEATDAGRAQVGGLLEGAGLQR